jgi:hypothetical protein
MCHQKTLQLLQLLQFDFLIVPVSAPSTESDRQVSNQSIKRQIAAQKSSR